MRRARRIDPGEGLVADEHAGWAGDRPGELEAAPLPRRELPGADPEPLAQPDLRGSLRRVPGRGGGDLLECHEVLTDREVPEDAGALGDVADARPPSLP